MKASDFDQARRDQIVRRHKRTFIQFYIEMRQIVHSSRLTRNGYLTIIPDSNFTHGFKRVDTVEMNYVKVTTTFHIHRYSGGLCVTIREAKNG